MKIRHSLLTLCALVLITETSASVFRGTVTQTVTHTDQPGLVCGDQVFGWYEYESNDVDGIFGTDQYCDFNDPSATPTLEGSVFGFFGWTEDGWLPFESTGFRSRTHLVVMDGLVTDFVAEGQIGGGDYGFEGSEFSISNLNMIAGEAYTTRGTLSFSAPAAVPEGITSTFLLVGMSLTGLYCLKRITS